MRLLVEHGARPLGQALGSGASAEGLLGFRP